MYFDNKFLSFNELYFHKKINNSLINLTKNNIHNINNLIFFGKSGIGKRTRIYTFLNNKFFEGVYNLKNRS